MLVPRRDDPPVPDLRRDESPAAVGYAEVRSDAAIEPSRAEGKNPNARSIGRPLQGVLLCIVAYGLFSLQDASMKWFAADYSVVTPLFWRSLAILAACAAIGRGRMMREAVRSPAKAIVAWRAIVSLVAWLFYYAAAQRLSLAEMTTLYFAAPIMVVVLAVVVLKERASPSQWAAVLLGFAGVVVASRPGYMASPLAIATILVAAALWAYGYVLLRQIRGRMGVGTQVLATNAVFVIALGVALPWQGVQADLPTTGMMALIGIVSGLGQFALFASFERASATVLAPFEYSGLIWAFLLSNLIWHTHGNAMVGIGAALIAVSGATSAYAAYRSGKARLPLKRARKSRV